MSKKNIIFKAKIRVQPYNQSLWIVAAGSVFAAHKEMVDVFGEPPDDVDVAGRCLDGVEAYGLLFKAGATLTHGTIAHEVFHFVHALHKWSGDKFSAKHQEPYSWMADWVTDQVYAQFKKAKIRIR